MEQNLNCFIKEKGTCYNLTSKYYGESKDLQYFGYVRHSFVAPHRTVRYKIQLIISNSNSPDSTVWVKARFQNPYFWTQLTLPDGHCFCNPLKLSWSLYLSIYVCSYLSVPFFLIYLSIYLSIYFEIFGLVVNLKYCRSMTLTQGIIYGRYWILYLLDICDNLFFHPVWVKY